MGWGGGVSQQKSNLGNDVNLAIPDDYTKFTDNANPTLIEGGSK